MNPERKAVANRILTSIDRGVRRAYNTRDIKHACDSLRSDLEWLEVTHLPLHLLRDTVISILGK